MIINEKSIKTITISAVGDCLIGTDENLPYRNSFHDIYRKQNNDYSYFLKKVKPIFKRDDLTIANLETPLTNATEKEHKAYRFKGDPSYANILKAGNIDVVNIANNHMHDYLEQGYQDTIYYLEKAGIKYFGSDVFKAKSSKAGFLNYEHQLIEEVKGIRIGLLGYKVWFYPEIVRAKIKDDLVHMKKLTDIIVVSFHWGKELRYYPLTEQKEMAHFVIDHGADLILGHHPHVIQGIEVYKNKNIVYSLGNFCFGILNPKDKDTFIYQHTFIFQDNELIKETNKIIPCSISSSIKMNNYQPTPLKGMAKDRVLNRIRRYSNSL